MNYCTSVVDYAMKNNLLMSTPALDDQEGRLVHVCQKVENEPKADGLSKEEITTMAEAFYSRKLNLDSYPFIELHASTTPARLHSKDLQPHNQVAV